MNKNHAQPKPSLFLIALTTIFGLQLMRVLMPQFLFILRDRLGFDTLIVGLAALLVFLTAFLAAPVNRFLGSLPALLITTIVVGFTRLGLQLWNADPLGDMFLAATGTIAFFLFIPIVLGLSRRQGPQGTANFGLAILLALILDLAIHGTAVV